MEGSPVVILQDPRGLVLWPWSRVASMRDERAGRVEFTSLDGEVAHRPGPVTRPPGEFPDPIVPKLGLPSSAVLYLDGEDRRSWWVTDQGRIPVSDRPSANRHQHPWLVGAGTRWVNVARLRRITFEYPRYDLHLDEGTVLPISRVASRRLARGLGLQDLRSLEPMTEPQRLLFALGVRDWPFDLARAAAEWLHREFDGDPVRLIANLLAQEPDLERIAPTLAGAGLSLPRRPDPEGAAPPEVQSRRRAAQADTEALLHGALPLVEWFRRYGAPEEVEDPQLYLSRIVFHALQAEAAPAIGAASPRTVVVAENADLARALPPGVETLVLDEHPPALALQALGGGSFRVVGYTSFSPRGWGLVDGVIRLLRLRGCQASLVGHLVRPERLSPEERRALAFRETPRGRDHRMAAAWTRLTGSRAHFHAEALPAEAVQAALREELHGLPPTGPASRPVRRAGLVYAQDADGLVFHPVEEVLSVREEALGRVEIRTASGLSWAASPLPPTGPAGSAPRRHLGLPPREVLALEIATEASRWLTDHGTLEGTDHASQGLEAHPHLGKIGGHYLNLQRLRRVRPQRIRLDTGQEFPLHHKSQQSLAEALGLLDLHDLPGTTPQHRALLREGLRDWPRRVFPDPPFELTKQGGGTERLLVATLLWEIFRLGPEEGWGRTHRDLFYNPLIPALRAAGFRERFRPALAEFEQDPHWLLLLAVATRLVGHDRLFDYEALRFVDEHPERRALSTERPDHLVLGEKDSLEPILAALRAEFGVGTFLSGGTPRLIQTEWLAKEIRRLLAGRPLHLYTVVDWDPGGHHCTRTLVSHFERYGVEVASVHDLVTPARFTARELAELSYALRNDDPRHRSRIANWVKRTGGIGGRARGIHADHLPLERIASALRELLRR